MYPNQYADPTVQNPYARNLQNLKEFLRKPVVLVLAILSSLQFLVTLIISLTGAQNIDVSDYFDYYVDPEFIQMFSTTTVATALIASIIPILTCTALWIIYFKSRSDDPASTPSAGLTIFYVLSIIELCFVGLVLLLFLIVMLAGGALASSAYWEGQMIMAIMILVFLMVAPIFLLITIGQLRFAGSLRASARGTVLKTGGSVLLGVVYLILVSISAIGVMTDLADLGGDLNFYSFINGLLSVAVMTLYAVVALSYNSYAKGKNLQYAMEQQNATFLQANAYAPAQPGAPSYYGQPQGYPQQPQSYGASPYASQQPQVPTYGQSGQIPGYPPTPTPTAPAYMSPQPSVQQAEETPAFQNVPVVPGAPDGQNGEFPAAQPAVEQTAAPEEITCPVCGCSIVQGDHICPQCGTLI